MMPDLITDGGSKEANEKHPKKGGKLDKYKWYIIGGLAVIAVLVFYFTRQSSANSSSSAADQAAAGIDPSTGIPYASEYGAGGAYGIPGPTGATGATGATGPRGPRGPAGKAPVKKKKKKTTKATTTPTAVSTILRKPVATATHPTITAVSNATHPANKTAAAHRSNTQKASRARPARKAA